MDRDGHEGDQRNAPAALRSPGAKNIRSAHDRIPQSPSDVNIAMRTVILLLVALLPTLRAAGALEGVRVSPDGRGFVLAESNKPFVPWGFNYGAMNGLLDDDWQDKWDVIERD